MSLIHYLTDGERGKYHIQAYLSSIDHRNLTPVGCCWFISNVLVFKTIEHCEQLKIIYLWATYYFRCSCWMNERYVCMREVPLPHKPYLDIGWLLVWIFQGGVCWSKHTLEENLSITTIYCDLAIATYEEKCIKKSWVVN